MYLPNFLNGFDRLVAFDAETTGKRTPDAEFVRKQPFAWRAPGIIIEVGFVEMLRQGEGWRKGETWSSRVNPDGPIDPEATKIHRIRPADLKNAPRFPMIVPKVKDFVGESPIVAHAYKNERDFLDYEFARAKVIPWGESAYADERYICTQVLFAQLFPGASKSLTSAALRAGAGVVGDFVSRQAGGGADVAGEVEERARVVVVGHCELARGMKRRERRVGLDGELVEREVLGRLGNGAFEFGAPHLRRLARPRIDEIERITLERGARDGDGIERLAGGVHPPQSQRTRHAPTQAQVVMGAPQGDRGHGYRPRGIAHEAWRRALRSAGGVAFDRYRGGSQRRHVQLCSQSPKAALRAAT